MGEKGGVMKRLPTSNRAHSGESVAQIRTTIFRAPASGKYSICKDLGLPPPRPIPR